MQKHFKNGHAHLSCTSCNEKEKKVKSHTVLTLSTISINLLHSHFRTLAKFIQTGDVSRPKWETRRVESSWVSSQLVAHRNLCEAAEGSSVLLSVWNSNFNCQNCWQLKNVSSRNCIISCSYISYDCHNSRLDQRGKLVPAWLTTPGLSNWLIRPVRDSCCSSSD